MQGLYFRSGVFRDAPATRQKDHKSALLRQPRMPSFNSIVEVMLLITPSPFNDAQ
jgi:hypothetical protein